MAMALRHRPAGMISGMAVTTPGGNPLSRSNPPATRPAFGVQNTPHNILLNYGVGSVVSRLGLSDRATIRSVAIAWAAKETISASQSAPSISTLNCSTRIADRAVPRFAADGCNSGTERSPECHFPPHGQ